MIHRPPLLLVTGYCLLIALMLMPMAARAAVNATYAGVVWGHWRWADWYLFGAADGVPQGNELTAYLTQLALIDPIAALPRNKAPLMFQIGESDFYTPRANFTAFYSAGAAQTTRITTYASEHPMDVTPIRLDRDLWLAEQLGLPAGPNRSLWPAED